MPIYVTHWFYAVQYSKCVIISQVGTAYITADQRVNRAPENSQGLWLRPNLQFSWRWIVFYAGSSYVWINAVCNTFFLTVEGRIHPKLSKLNVTGLWCYDCFIDSYQEEPSASVAYPGIFFGGGFNKFSWGQRTERMRIWGQ